MGHIRFFKGASLSDKDRKSLQRSLDDERKKLLAALKDVDQRLSMLKDSKKKTKKKTKKKKKMKKA